MAKVAMVLVIVLLTTFSDGSAAPQNEVKVVASLTPYQSIAEEIIGDKGTVESIAAARQDAHFVQAKPSFSIMLTRADLLLATGLDLEVWMPAVIDKARNPLPDNTSAGVQDQILVQRTRSTRREHRQVQHTSDSVCPHSSQARPQQS